jgi:hypothetical protein
VRACVYIYIYKRTEGVYTTNPRKTYYTTSHNKFARKSVLLSLFVPWLHKRTSWTTKVYKSTLLLQTQWYVWSPSRLRLERLLPGYQENISRVPFLPGSFWGDDMRCLRVHDCRPPHTLTIAPSSCCWLVGKARCKRMGRPRTMQIWSAFPACICRVTYNRSKGRDLSDNVGVFLWFALFSGSLYLITRFQLCTSSCHYFSFRAYTSLD